MRSAFWTFRCMYTIPFYETLALCIGTYNLTEGVAMYELGGSKLGNMKAEYENLSGFCFPRLGIDLFSYSSEPFGLLGRFKKIGKLQLHRATESKRDPVMCTYLPRPKHIQITNKLYSRAFSTFCRYKEWCSPSLSYRHTSMRLDTNPRSHRYVSCIKYEHHPCMTSVASAKTADAPWLKNPSPCSFTATFHSSPPRVHSLQL